MNREFLLHIQIPAEGDVLRQERAIRSLRDELASAGLAVTFPDTAPLAAGAKGGGTLSDPALLVGLPAAASAASKIAVEAIKAWCARERHRSVRLSIDGDGTRTLDIDGTPTPAGERAIADFLDGAGS